MTNVIADRCTGRDNNLNLIRAIAAFFVMVSHSFPITQGAGAVEPLEPLIGRSLGWLSVAIFFILSGFLISRSFDRSDSLMRWIIARVLRLFPALVFVLLLTIFIIGPFVTQLSLAEYFSSSNVYSYFVRNMSLLFLQYDLPGVFISNPYGTAINGSLWTLFYEVSCYAGVFFLGIWGLLKKPIVLSGLFVIYIFVYFLILHSGGDAIHPRVSAVSKLSLPFILGCMVYVWREYFPLHFAYVVGLGFLSWLCNDTIFFTEIFIIWVGYFTLWFGYMPRGKLLRYNKVGDFSYGIYVYAFPMQQLSVFLLGEQNWYLNLATALPATLILAYLSWYIIEKPALGQIQPFMKKWQKFLNPAIPNI